MSIETGTRSLDVKRLMLKVTYALSSVVRAFDAGAEAYQRYKALVSEDLLPFVRADISQRDVDSATNWTAGAYHLSRSAMVK